MIGYLISNRLATLHELQTIYTMEDAFIMYEASIVPKYNEWKESKAIQERAKQ